MLKAVSTTQKAPHRFHDHAMTVPDIFLQLIHGDSTNNGETREETLEMRAERHATKHAINVACVLRCYGRRHQFLDPDLR
jgi:hypothetical protein